MPFKWPEGCTCSVFATPMDFAALGHMTGCPLRGQESLPLGAVGSAQLVKREHVYYKCQQPCEKQHCNYCDGGLAYCTVCKCAEGELADECPGNPDDALLPGEHDFKP